MDFRELKGKVSSIREKNIWRARPPLHLNDTSMLYERIRPRALCCCCSWRIGSGKTASGSIKCSKGIGFSYALRSVGCRCSLPWCGIPRAATTTSSMTISSSSSFRNRPRSDGCVEMNLYEADVSRAPQNVGQSIIHLNTKQPQQKQHQHPKKNVIVKIPRKIVSSSRVFPLIIGSLISSSVSRRIRIVMTTNRLRNVTYKMSEVCKITYPPASRKRDYALCPDSEFTYENFFGVKFILVPQSLEHLLFSEA